MVAWQQAVWRASGFVPTVADMAARIDGLRATHEWLVLEREIRSSDLRTGSRWSALATFQRSAETGFYVDSAHQRAAADASFTRRLANGAIGSLSRASRNPMSPATAFSVRSGFRLVSPRGMKESWHDVA
jgi:hypothetical protein